MRLIDAAVTEKIMSERYRELAKEYGHYDHYTTGYGDALSVIEDSPTIESEPVVRCKDCVYYDFEKGCPFRESGYFFKGNPLPHENDFCSYGEKRDNND